MSLTQEQVTFLNLHIIGGSKPLWTENNDGSVDVFDDFICVQEPLLVRLPVRFRIAHRMFNVSSCKLVSLDNAPITVMGSFHCYGNKLTSLVGCPQSVGGNFSCSNNQLTNLDGLPAAEEHGGNLYCSQNPLVPNRKLFQVLASHKLGNKDQEWVKEQLYMDLKNSIAGEYGLSKDNPLIEQLWKEMTRGLIMKGKNR